MSGQQPAPWRAQRDHAIAVHAEAERRRREAETGRARDLVAAFVQDATARGLRPTALRAFAVNGSATYRTALRGWYVRRDRSIAVGVDGQYYLLGVPASWSARLTGAPPAPSEPRPVIGVGARDGESVQLQLLLRRRREAGDDFP